MSDFFSTQDLIQGFEPAFTPALSSARTKVP